jgi:hypothetical protein
VNLIRIIGPPDGDLSAVSLKPRAAEGIKPSGGALRMQLLELNRRAPTHKQAYEEKHHEHYKQYPRNLRCGSSHAEQTQRARNQTDN